MSDIKLKPTDWNIDAAKYGIKPGDRVILTGKLRSDIVFTNLVDNVVISDEPSIIKGGVPGGRVVTFSNCKGVRITGSNAPLEITGGGQAIDFRDLSTDVEADNLYIHDVAYLAIAAKTDPTCDPKTQRGGFVLKNVYFHHNRIANIMTGEGYYIGESHYHTTVNVSCAGKVNAVKEHEVIGVQINNNTFENIGRDGIQVGATSAGCYIQDNKIKNFGMTKEYGQGSGITINPGTVAEVYNNIIDTGSGFGIIAQGPGGSKIHHNVIINTGTTKDGGGIMLASYGQNVGAYDVRNNTLLDINRVGIEYYSAADLNDNIINVKTGGQIIKIGASAKITDVGNMKFLGDRTFLKLDANYIPTKDSTVVPGIGIGDYKKPIPVVKREEGQLEIVTTDGLVEVFAVKPDGERIKIK